jgi:hypothetical protein
MSGFPALDFSSNPSKILVSSAYQHKYARKTTTLGLIEATFPRAAELIDPCGYCRREDGVFCIPWPDIPANQLFLVCPRCLWRKFHEVPKGPNRRAMLKRVFAHRVFGRGVKTTAAH